MKTSLILLFCLAGYMLQAQKIVEQHLPSNPGKKVVMNIQIADSIRIVSWNKNEVYAKASVNLSNNRYNDKYITSFDASGDEVRINAKVQNFQQHWNDSDRYNDRNNIVWEIYIPDGARLSVETIDGNITITGNPTAIKAKSISGFVDLQCSPNRKADLKMNTISGTIYTDLVLAGLNGNKGDNTISTELNGGGEDVDLESISGNIYLRKEQ